MSKLYYGPSSDVPTPSKRPYRLLGRFVDSGRTAADLLRGGPAHADRPPSSARVRSARLGRMTGMEAPPPGTTAGLEGDPPSGSSVARLLARPNFQRLWAGALASALGTAIGSIIITWLVYSSTLSPIAISLLGIVQLLPTLAFGILAGALVDRWDRKRLMIGCDVARAVTFGGLTVFVWAYGANTTVLLVVVFVVAAFGTLFRPATNATIPRIIGPDEVNDGNGLLQGGTTVAQFVGSPLGGVVLITAGAVAGLALNALTFAISGALIFLMVFPAAAARPQPPVAPSLFREVREGLRYLRSQTALLTITLTAMGGNFFFSIWGGFTVIYAVERLHLGAAGFGLLVAATTGGFALGSVLPGRLHTERAPGAWLPFTWGIAGAFVLLLAFASTLAVASLFEFAAGLLLSFGNTTWLTGVQRTVPDEYLGRFFATDEAGSFAMIPAAFAVGGVLILYLGITPTFVIAGLGGLVANFILLLSPEVWRWGREAPTRAETAAPAR